ncbi:MAG TPA: response regulator transcription factor, partial [Anaerolineae bacterium]|nr:response regulator transcription factor [Anaerolineae bacterium]
MTRARILLADDHDLFREGLAGLINAQPDLEVAGQAGDGLEALTLVRDLKPDLIVMDINMPICDGLEATRLIRAERAEAHIVMLTVHDEDENLFSAITAGAQGYMLKSLSAQDFLQGVRAALKGEAVLPPKLATHLLIEFARLADRPNQTA